jgi:hypothetical protein
MKDADISILRRVIIVSVHGTLKLEIGNLAFMLLYYFR